MVRTKPEDLGKKTTYFTTSYWESFVERVPQLIMLLGHLTQLGEDIGNATGPETTVKISPSKQVICTSADSVPVAKIQTLKDGHVVHNFTIAVLVAELQTILNLVPQIKQALDDVSRTFDLPFYAKVVNRANAMTAVHKWYLQSPVLGIINSAQNWSFDYDSISNEGSEALIDAKLSSGSATTDHIMMYMWRKEVPTPSLAAIKDVCAMFLLDMGVREVLKSKCLRCQNPDMEEGWGDHSCEMPNDKKDFGAIDLDEPAFSGLVSKLVNKLPQNMPPGNYLPFNEIVRHAAVALRSI